MNIKISKQVVDNIKEGVKQGLELNEYLKTLNAFYWVDREELLIFDPQPTLRDCNTNGPLLDPITYYTLQEQTKGE